MNPQVLKQKWTREEDDTVQRLQASIGNKWVTIAKSLPGRYAGGITAVLYAAIQLSDSDLVSTCMGN